jgi:hypothetical protein
MSKPVRYRPRQIRVRSLHEKPAEKDLTLQNNEIMWNITGTGDSFQIIKPIKSTSRAGHVERYQLQSYRHHFKHFFVTL